MASSEGALSAVVVAHPDDETLWLSSVLAAADRVVFCFGAPFGKPEKSAARRRAVAALPLPHLIDLALPESGAGFSVDWKTPQLTETGVAINQAAPRGRYEANYPTLIAALRPALAGMRAVYTHNPWGEYGHAEHIQVHRAVTALQAELGFTIWFSNYVGPESRSLARQLGVLPCRAERRIVRPDYALAARLRSVYRHYDAWTWSRFHRWPPEEVFYSRPDCRSAGALAPLTGEWLLDVAGLGWKRWRAARWRLD
jgi:LmbE family N-acetylglucosaminyl deacetylase